jgi:hypothetical protein
MILPFREFDAENHRGLSNLPQMPQTSSSPPSRLVISWWDREVHVWHFPKGHQSSNGTADNEEIQKQLSKIYIQVSWMQDDLIDCADPLRRERRTLLQPAFPSLVISLQSPPALRFDCLA